MKKLLLQIVLFIFIGTRAVANEYSRFDSIREAYARGNYSQVILLGEQDFEPKSLNYLASAYAKVGRFPEAINSLKQLLAISNDPIPIKFNLAQLLIEIGEYDEAKKLALSINVDESTHYQTFAKAILGNIHAKRGEYQKAVGVYIDSLNSSHNNQDKSRFFILQNLATTQKLWINKLKQEADWASSFEPEVSNKLLKQVDEIEKQRQSIVSEILRLIPNFEATETLKFRITLSRDGEANFTEQQLLSEVKALPDSITKGELFIKLGDPLSALEIAKKLQNHRFLSFSLGAVADFYQAKGNLDKALTFFLKAQKAALQVGDWDSLYLWQWKTAKIYRNSHQSQKALLAYNEAFNSLQYLRSELAAKGQIVIFDNLQSLYLEALEFFLEQPPSQEKLRKIKQILKQYQISLVESYFNSPCYLPLKVFNLPENQAAIYFISLSEDTYLLLELPHQKFELFKLNLPQKELHLMAVTWRKQLKDYTSDDYRPLAKTLYTKLISPIEQILLSHKINTLLIQPSGVLQNLPLAALKDENDKYLIEKLNISFSIGINPKNSLLIDRNFGTIFGLANPPAPLSPLPGVKEEVSIIGKLTNSIPLLNESFTSDNFLFLVSQQKQQKSFLHLATHGKFGGNAEQSWLQAYDKKIFLPQLESILLSSSPIHLLVLSGCETAVGNNRTLLGMGGLAVRTNVNHVVSTLWQIEDRQSSILIADFYENYRQGYDPSLALHKAQQEFVNKNNNQHPYFWAGYISISN